MKIEKLTENKIRIILNIDDLTRKNIDIHTLIRDTNSTQRLFEYMLKQAQKEVDFNVGGSRLLIEAFISAEGFFVLTFTKMPSDLHSSKTTIPKSKPKAKRKITNLLSNTAIYEFNSFDEFCNFCTYIKDSKLGDLKKLAKAISLYEYESKYFLVFSNIDTDFKYLSLFYISISEFAKLVSNSSSLVSRLNEYGKVVIKNNAIQNGIKFFATTENR